MLVEMTIRNLAVIESIRVQCKQGFHVLTGETGAGKSMIIDALSLIVGGRGSSDLIRHGSDKAEIECVFDFQEDHPIWDILQEKGIEAPKDEYIVIRREMTAQGKSSGRVNGQFVNLSTLREIGEWIVNIHGQHEHQSLLKVDRHIDWLDMYGESTILPIKEKYQQSYSKYKQLSQELQQLRNMSQQSLQMADLYRFQVEEIAAAQLKTGEDEWLTEEKQKLGNAEKIVQAVSEAYELIYGHQGLEAIGQAMQRMEAITKFDPSILAPLSEQIQSAYYQLEDAAYQLRDYVEHLEFDPERLNEIEQRLDVISSLKRKYGDSIEEILKYHDQMKKELDQIEHKDERIAELEHKLQCETELLTDLAQQLTEARKQSAVSLAEQIEHELRDLHMERTQFQVQIDRLEQFTKQGLDRIEFMISPNPGEPVKPLSKIVSGGELSRIMLALKTVFASVDRIPVLVFDEVDTGVSGRAAQAIAEKLAQLAQECQVFSITHLPQVACMADVHYAIRKMVDGDRTFTRIHDLDDEQRIEELARMLGGVQVTETTQHHAKEMLDMANKKKEQWNHLKVINQ